MDTPEAVKRFASQLTAFQRPLYLFIVSLVHHAADADDVLQDVNRILWEKADEYEPGTNFAAWAYRVAHYQVLTLRKQKARQLSRFRDATLELIAQDAARLLDDEPAERDALRGCLGKLTAGDRDLVTRRYLAETDMHALAKQLDRPEKSLYRSIARIREMLLDCIQRTLAAEAAR